MHVMHVMEQQVQSDTPESHYWTFNVSWAWRGTDDSELLCDTPDYTTDHWGNPYNGTVIIVKVGVCLNGIKALNAEVSSRHPYLCLPSMLTH
jgi:hypothetical protein